MHPRLALDIGWPDIASVIAPPRGTAAAEIEARAPAGAAALPALSVRTAFDALLSELALRPGAEVAMSAVNIEGMAAIVEAHGLVVRPIDLDLRTLASDPAAAAAAIGPRTGLAVVAHLYGARSPVNEIAALCAARGVLLVEDCAQAFAGELTLGEGADVALYSFGPIKSATALGGAVAVVRDPALAARLGARLAALPPLSEGWFLRRAAKYGALKVLNGPRLYGLLLRLIRLAGRDPDMAIGGLARGFSGGDLIARIRRAPPPRLLALLARRLRQARPPAARWARAWSVLTTLSATSVPGAGAPQATWWLAPVLSRDPARLIAGLRTRGFDATRGATSLRALGATAIAVPGARRLMDQVVYLPLTPYVSAKAAARLAAAVRDLEGADPRVAQSEAMAA